MNEVEENGKCYVLILIERSFVHFSPRLCICSTTPVYFGWRNGSGGAETLFGGVKEHVVPLDGSKIGECKNYVCLFS